VPNAKATHGRHPSARRPVVEPPAHPLFGPNLSAQQGKNKLAFTGKAT
jgi:hypothetical protein